MRSVLAAFLCLAWAGSQAAAKPDPMIEMTGLIERFESVIQAPGAAGERARWTTLKALADLRTPEVRLQLKRLLEQYGRSNRRVAIGVLGALVRHGRADDIDHAVRWVERARDPLIVEMLPEILKRIQREASKRHLRSSVLTGSTPLIKAQIIRTLGLSNDPACVLPLMRLLQSTDLRVQVEALLALGTLQDTRARVSIELFLRSDDARIRASSAQALGRMGSVDSIPALSKSLQDKSDLVVESAAEALGAIDSPKAVPALLEGLRKYQKDNIRLADTFTNALRMISGKGIPPDADLWDHWWDAVKDRPLVKASEKPGTKSVPGARYYGFPVRSSKVLFLLDVSRSMGWNERLETAQDELQRTLETLPATTRFNVIVYSDEARPWRAKLTKARPSAVRSATTFVRKQQPDNGTNTHGALQAAFNDPSVDTVFLLSDGYPSVGVIIDPELIRVTVQNMNRFRRLRIHCIALMRGDPPAAFAGRENPSQARTFLENLAKENHGWFHDVR